MTEKVKIFPKQEPKTPPGWEEFDWAKKKESADYECRDKAKYGACNSYPHCPCKSMKPEKV